MDYAEQFIRLNCSLMSDYRMMKLRADMKCMGIGLYLEMMLFLRKQEDYRHDFNELDLLAERWGATVDDLRHLIKDFNLFIITEDGYFRCLYLDEVMGYQNKVPEQRSAAGSKDGRSADRKKTVQLSEKKITSTVLAEADKAVDKVTGDEAIKCMKNTIEKSDDENATEKVLQCIDSEFVEWCSQASFKQNFIREEKNRKEKKKKDDVDIIQRNIDIGDDVFFCDEENSRATLRRRCCCNEILPVRMPVDTLRTMPDSEERGNGPPKEKCTSFRLLKAVCSPIACC